MSQEQSQKKFISSNEGAILLGVDKKSFFYYAESRDVERRENKEGGKERYEYAYEDLLSIKESVQSSRYSKRQSSKASQADIKKIETPPVKEKVKLDSASDWAIREDLPHIYVLDCEVYGIEYSVPATKTLQWLEKNDTAIRVLYNSENRRDIWGCITLLPMEEETIYDILRGDLSEQEISQKHILAYEPNREYSCYVASCVVLPEKRSSFNTLFNSIMSYWCDHPEIHIRKLYGFAAGASEDMTQENDGLRMIKKLFFSPRYDIDENAWELDLDRYNPSPMIQKYQKCRQKSHNSMSV